VSDGRGIYFDKVMAIVLREAQGAKKRTMSEPSGVVAQLAEQPPFKRTVGGSLPSDATTVLSGSHP
jgi:hypothetical protein